VLSKTGPGEFNLSTDPQSARVIAFYLPQFHPIPENDTWWGKGFTEWRNVARAKPRFEGHYQPHIPADLGFYDLRLAETREAQAALARQSGISGFMYYHYWFDGRELLERPLRDVVTTGVPSFPFCICWANENWTRRWDGGAGEVLMAQRYSAEDDLRHIRHLVQYLQDERYITVDGKPLLCIYRIDELPDPRRTTDLWRDEAVRAGLPDLYLCHVISSGVLDPDPSHYGCDAAIEFQPDWRRLPPRIEPRRRGLRRRVRADDPFALNGVLQYPELVAAAMATPAVPYKLFPCVTPGWDNSPRKPHSAYIFINNTPRLYGVWLEHALRTAQGHFTGDERLVFVNAWNEWAEGNHLEPDLRWGHAFLDASKAAIEKAAAL
jgi:lipopolysaccharide biosynthesis protein